MKKNKKPSVVYLKDNRDYDSKGNVVKYEAKVSENTPLEPYDPAYLGETEERDIISASEKSFFRKVSILQNKLRRSKIGYEWMPSWECFRIQKFIDSDYPMYRYVRVNVEENDYSFGTEKEDLVFSTRVSEVVEAAKAWLDKNI